MWNFVAVLACSISGEGKLDELLHIISIFLLDFSYAGFFLLFIVSVKTFLISGVQIFLLATIYALSGCPLSYVLWYKPLYSAMR